MRRLRVAGIQVLSLPGRPDENLERASALVQQAVSAGARLVLGPELMTPGYALDSSIWQFAEERGGDTETWALAQARRHRIYLGAGYLERAGDDYYNTFFLAGPGGEVVGRVRKWDFGYFESWIFRSGRTPRVIDSEIGKLGVGVCFDAYRQDFLLEMRQQAPDLLLLPHSSAVAPVFPRFGEAIRESLEGIAPCCSRFLGVPALLVNKAGPAPFTGRLMGSRFLPVRLDFEGLSRITNGRGDVLAALEMGEGVLTAELELGREAPPAEPLLPPVSSFWSLPPRRWGRGLALCHRILTRLGERSYRRRARARAQGQK